MRSRHWLPVCLAVLLLLLAALAGCAAARDGYVAAPTAAAAATAAAPAAQSNDTSGGAVAPDVNQGDASAYGRKVVYTETMSLEAADASQALKDLSDRAVALGGYVAGMQYDGSTATGTLTLRVPPEKMRDFEAAVGQAGRVLDAKKSSDDVTDKYSDTASRLKNAQAQEAQLLLIMQKAVTIDDTLKVRKELDAVQQQIEEYQGELKLMDNQVGFSTVTVSVRQPPKPVVTASPSPEPTSGVKFWGFEAVGQKIARGASDSFNWTLNALSTLLMVLSYIILPLVVAAAVVILILVLNRRAKKRRKPTPPTV